jgi:hypothetical protein
VAFVPADAVAGAEGVDDPRQGLQAAEGQLKGARQVDHAVGVGESGLLLGGERVCLGLRVIADVSAGGLAA